MNEEIQFEKYKNRTADYHYQQISRKNLRKFNAFTEARYIKHIQLVKKQLAEFDINKTEIINILDVGCGDGVLLFLLKKKLPEYNFRFHGIDLSAEALKIAKKKIPDGIFIETGVYDLTFPDYYFDFVISSDVIEHVNNTEKMLTEIRRVAKQEARLIISTPIRYTEKPFDKMHVKEFFQKEFIEVISRKFNFITLIESHKQIHYLKYIKQSSLLKISINRYFYNILCVLGKNKFLEPIKSISDFPTYMFAVCKVNSSSE